MMLSRHSRRTVRIQPTRSKEGVISFRHAGELHPRYDELDPRNLSFEARRVDVDLRECAFVRLPAALWCIVYLSLAVERGVRCRLLVPKNTWACVYLKTLGVFDILKEKGVEVDDRDIHPLDDRTTVLPVTQFATIPDASRFAGQASDAINSKHVSSGGDPLEVADLFDELAVNSAHHSESEIGAFGCVQYFDSEAGARFVFAVADGGIGIHGSLSQNDSLRGRANYDWDALELAVRERVSSKGNAPLSGIGLYGVGENVRRSNRTLLLHSGMGALQIHEDQQRTARRTRLFPGTLAFLSIPA